MASTIIQSVRYRRLREIRLLFQTNQHSHPTSAGPPLQFAAPPRLSFQFASPASLRFRNNARDAAGHRAAIRPARYLHSVTRAHCTQCRHPQLLVHSLTTQHPLIMLLPVHIQTTNRQPNFRRFPCSSNWARRRKKQRSITALWTSLYANSHK